MPELVDIEQDEKGLIWKLGVEDLLEISAVTIPANSGATFEITKGIFGGCSGLPDMKDEKIYKQDSRIYKEDSYGIK